MPLWIITAACTVMNHIDTFSPASLGGLALRVLLRNVLVVSVKGWRDAEVLRYVYSKRLIVCHSALADNCYPTFLVPCS